MKLPRKASHCGAVGAGELNFITALVGEAISMSVTLRQEFAVSTLWPALMRSKKVYLKSSAVILSPLWNVTSSRNSTVMLWPSAASSHLVISFGTRSSFSFWSSGWSNTSLKIGCASGVKRWFGSHDGTSLGQPMVTLSFACANATSPTSALPAAPRPSICNAVLRSTFMVSPRSGGRLFEA